MYLSKLNPFYKGVLVMLVALALAFTFPSISSIWLNTSVFIIAMILLVTGTNKAKTAFKFILITAVPATGYLITGLYFADGHTADSFAMSITNLQSGLHIATRMYAFLGLGMVFSLSTNPYDFVKSLQKDAKLPRKFAYGVLCAVHLLPYMKNEYFNARLALQVRGAHVGVFSIKPLFSTMVNCIRWSEMLSIAMQSKGFCEENNA